MYIDSNKKHLKQKVKLWIHLYPEDIDFENIRM